MEAAHRAQEGAWVQDRRSGGVECEQWHSLVEVIHPGVRWLQRKRYTVLENWVLVNTQAF